jgi:hypothetical protein
VITDSGTRCREVYAPADEVLQAGGGSDARATNLAAEGGCDAFDLSRACLELIVEQLAAVQADELEHGELEVLIEREGRELLRQLLQDRLDLGAVREQRLDTVSDGRGVPRPAVERDHRRRLSSQFGEVTVARLAYRARAEENLYVADGVLNLPDEHASHGVRRLAAVGAAAGSFEHATGQVRERTGLELGKRQVEELTVRAAVDFDAFYAERVSGAEPERGEDDVLVLSCDGKGIVMRAEALREATAKAAQRASPKLTTRLSKGEKSNRKRIAEVGAVYEVEPVPRTPAEVLAPAKDKTLKPPRAARKWVTASVVEDAATVIADVFDEAERRDGDHQRSWVALVDGANHQIDRIKAETKQRKLKGKVTIIVDLIHVMEYVWDSAWCFFKEGDPAAERWVHEKTLAILEGKAGIVAAAIRRKATKLGLSEEKRAKADRTADYLLNKAPYLDYPTALTNGWPIATGVIEGACRHLVKDRMDITGARWGLAGAEAILKLRALIINGDFDDYWQYHLAHERHRNHDLRYTNGVIPRQT